MTSTALRVGGVAVGGVAVLLIMLHSAANALSRTYANSPVPGTLEWVSGWYMPLVVFLGLVVAQQRGEHIDANLLLIRAPEPVQRFYGVLVNTLTAVVVLAMAWFALGEARSQHAIGTVVGISSIPQWPVMYIVPLGMALYVFHLLLDNVVLLSRRSETEREQGTGTSGPDPVDHRAP